jgi:hypothetical protein
MRSTTEKHNVFSDLIDLKDVDHKRPVLVITDAEKALS